MPRARPTRGATLHPGQPSAAHLVKIPAFTLVDEGAWLFHEPALFRAPEAVLERFVATGPGDLLPLPASMPDNIAFD